MENNSKKKQKRKSNFLYDFVKITGALPTLLYFRHKVHYVGEKPSLKGPLVISANHVGFTDPLLLLCVFWRRRVGFLATKDLYKPGFMSWFLPKVHCIKVDKENFSMNSFHEVRDRLMQKQAIMIFPEGKINHDSSSFLAFKSGAVLMAHAGAARIIPVYIAKREKWYRRANVVIGEAIDVRAELGERASMEDLSRLNDMLAEKEAALKTYYESKKTKKIKKEEKV